MADKNELDSENNDIDNNDDIETSATENKWEDPVLPADDFADSDGDLDEEEEEEDESRQKKGKSGLALFALFAVLALGGAGYAYTHFSGLTASEAEHTDVALVNPVPSVEPVPAATDPAAAPSLPVIAEPSMAQPEPQPEPAAPAAPPKARRCRPRQACRKSRRRFRPLPPWSRWCRPRSLSPSSPRRNRRLSLRPCRL